MPTTVRSATNKKAIRFMLVAPFVGYLFALLSSPYLSVLFGFRRRLLDQLRHFSRVRQHGQMIRRHGD